MKTYHTYLDRLEAKKSLRKALKLKKRIPELESFILQDLSTALDYAQNVIKGRWSELEKIILNSYNSEKMILYYALDVAKKRWPEGETILLAANQPWNVFKYFMYLVQERWPEAEHVLKGSNAWPKYLKIIFGDYVVSKYFDNILEKILDIKTDKEKWEFLEKEGATEEAIKALNVIGIPRELQEYIIKKNSYLINYIDNTDPDVRARYKNELDTTGIEI